MNPELQPLIKEKEKIERRLNDYRWLFDTSDNATIILDQDGYCLDCNRAFYSQMGYAQKIDKKYHPSAISPKNQPDGKCSFKKANEMLQIAMSKGKFSFEWMHRRPDGHEFLSHVTLELIDFDGKKCIRAVINDISEIKKLERLVKERTVELAQKNKELGHLAIIDPLTDLYNRRKFDEVLSEIWHYSGRSKNLLGILFLDIDFFKLFNDNYGHAAGDLCLKQIAVLLKNTLRRKSDFVARYGGEEFVIIMPSTEESYMQEIAAGIIGAVNDAKIPHEYSKISSHVTVSIGCAITVPGQHCHQTTELLKAADDMLYKAKDNGRNRFDIVKLE